MNRPILGSSPAVKEMLKLISKVATSKTNVLVIGESGTGKELVARMIHESSPLKGRPFVPVNCGAIPETLIESEMFGHKRGSFTGAVGDKPGLFEVANGGTLFLDEVGELPLSMQVKLLRAIQERSFRKVGGTEDVKVDLRIIAATNRDLESQVALGKFREDLYYRLNVILIKTPTLKERKGDIFILADAFLKKFATKLGRPLQGFDPEALEALMAHSWPGNIRELENVVERAVTLETDELIRLHSLPGAVRDAVLGKGASLLSKIAITPIDLANGPITLSEYLADVERTVVQCTLVYAKSHVEAARLLGLDLPIFEALALRLGVIK